jgi:hypothetical protein
VRQPKNAPRDAVRGLVGDSETAIRKLIAEDSRQSATQRKPGERTLCSDSPAMLALKL